MEDFKPATRSRIENTIISLAAKTKDLSRNKIYEAAYIDLKTTPEELFDRSPSSNYSKARSYIGMIISEMAKAKKISIGEDGSISLIISEVVENKSFLLANKQRLLLERMFNKYLSVKEARQRKSGTKASILRSFIGNEIKTLQNDNEFSDDELFQKSCESFEKLKVFRDRFHDETVSNTDKSLSSNRELFPSESINQIVLSIESKYRECVTNVISVSDYENELVVEMGRLFGFAEEFFEIFTFQLIARVYGESLISASTNAGPTDEGVDGEYVIRDAMGFTENIIMQAKTKKNEKAAVSEKTLREYLGVLRLKKGDKLLLVSNAKISKEVKEKAKNLRDVRLIDLMELYNLMKHTKFGILIVNDIPKLDVMLLSSLIEPKTNISAN